VGRTVGWIFLLQMAIAPLAYFGLMAPLSAPGGVLQAAQFAPQLRLAGVLVLLAALLSLAAAVVTLPLVRQHGERMAFAYLALCAAGVATLAAETVAMRGMLAFSMDAIRTSGSPEVVAGLARLSRRAWIDAHYTNLLIAHGTVLLFGVILLRHALVPRALAAIVVVAASLSTAGVAAPLLGFPFSFRVIAPMAVVQLGLVAWLIVKGFDDAKLSQGVT
jgi:hypothetical protein